MKKRSGDEGRYESEMLMRKPPLGTPLDWDNPLNKDLGMHLAMNEGHGDKVQDLSMNGNHGTLNNFAFPPTTTSGWNPGHTGIGLNFDANNDLINCGNHTSLNPPTEITFSALINPKSLTVGDGLFDKYVSGVGLRSYRIFVEVDTSKLAFQISSTGDNNEKQIADMGIVTNEWQNVVLTYNHGIFKAYRNGNAVSVDDDFVFTSIHQSTTNLFVGTRQADILSFDGGIDQPRIQSRVWTAKEVKDYAINPWQVYLQP